jgi:hypothetical protein
MESRGQFLQHTGPHGCVPAGQLNACCADPISMRRALTKRTIRMGTPNGLEVGVNSFARNPDCIASTLRPGSRVSIRTGDRIWPDHPRIVLRSMVKGFVGRCEVAHSPQKFLRQQFPILPDRRRRARRRRARSAISCSANAAKKRADTKRARRQSQPRGVVRSLLD